MLREYEQLLDVEADNETVWFSDVVSQVSFPCLRTVFSLSSFYVALAQQIDGRSGDGKQRTLVLTARDM